MSQLKRLASQTAIYGVSSILGRLINYTLVPLHTSVFGTMAMGEVGILFSYTAIFLVVYTFGMETAYFRFVNKEDTQETYNKASTAVIAISTFLSVIILAAAPKIAILIGLPDAVLLIRWLAVILWIDGIMAIPFARLRHENRPILFAGIRVSNIFINVGLQLCFLWLFPNLIDIEILNNTDGTPGIGYIFLANLIANLFLFPLLWGYLRKIRFTFDWQAFKPMLRYAFPIMITGLAGMFNEQLANLMIEYFLPDDFYDTMSSTEAVGVYNQTLKLGVFMMLAIQAFRYAAEPFFFSQASDKNSPELFARVMHYFMLSGLVLLFAVSVNVDLIGAIFLRKPEFRVALYLVPILLFAKLLNGIYLNLSIWFKLTDRTVYGMYFSILGAAITIGGNILLIPYIGYNGGALTMVLCYLVMCAVCYYYGQKYYPIPYQFSKIIPYLFATFLLVLLSGSFHLQNFLLESAIRVTITLLILLGLFLREKRHLLPKAG
ncbi:lipopolysaccharide biosynthesis protein [Fulvivirga sedimenti]|uniref:Polysaccharide biosynthesis C-terminal domain-containing protein n=1 Tax=Fulvivirga sedimenti TaxID=2879465 RepID=A0A9X1HUA2_9BACT|nr:polysaccharide biosynthesis C-terminal domain-containing protein [Fulvivirga sedimenti]MCA6078066.1 polysaccharide biosynthesis C-terminal domain-containing protein [Fulvivirga sedimenti]